MSRIHSKCQTCRWWVEMGDSVWGAAGELGTCHFAPPRPLVGEDSERWPITKADDFCSEHDV
jgi:hypothetical protein